MVEPIPVCGAERAADPGLDLLRGRIGVLPIAVCRIGRHGLRVGLVRPEKRNAISLSTAILLTDLFRLIADMPDIRLVVLRGDGDFCGGVDLSDRGGPDPEENVRAMARLFEALAALPQFSLALVAGVALGAGLGLVAACDGAVATVDARFGTPEVCSGLIPSVISPYIITAVGRRAAIRLFATGMSIDAGVAAGLGLVEAVVADVDALDVEEVRFGDMIGRVAPGALCEAKRLGDLAGRPMGADLIIETVRRTVARMAEPEVREGLRAFREKRLPDWATSSA